MNDLNQLSTDRVTASWRTAGVTDTALDGYQAGYNHIKSGLKQDINQRPDTNGPEITKHDVSIEHAGMLMCYVFLKLSLSDNHHPGNEC